MDKLLFITHKLFGYKFNDFLIKKIGKRVRIFCGNDGFCWFAKLGNWITAIDDTTCSAEYVAAVTEDWED